MGGIGSWLVGAVQLIAGIFLTATGIGSGLGLKLILSGALTIISGMLSPAGRSGWGSSPRYGFDNVSNTTREGAPVPIVYGEEVVAPGIISQVTEETESDTILKLLCLVSEGEIESISDVRLDDTPIANLSGIEVATRLGTDDQTAIEGFSLIGTPWPASTRLTKDSVHVHTGKAEVDALIWGITFPSGLFGVANDGDLDYRAFRFRLEYAVGDSPSESDWRPVTPRQWHQKSVGGYWTGQAVANNFFVHEGGNKWRTGNRKTQSPVRFQMRLELAAEEGRGRGRFSLRVTGAEASHPKRTNIPTLVRVIEVLNETRSYPGTALLALTIPGQAQLSGGTPRVTCRVKGRKVYDPRTGTTAWSRNPVLCLRDLLLSPRYGLGDDLVQADLDDGVGGSWRTAADECDAVVTGPGYPSGHARHELDLVVDTKAPARDYATAICLTSRLTLYAADGTLRVVRDADRASVRSFSETEGDGERRSILAGQNEQSGDFVSSLVDSVVPASQRWTSVRVRYVDRDKDYAQQVIEVSDLRIPVTGAVSGGPFELGEKIRNSNDTARAIVSRPYNSGDPYLYVSELDGYEGAEWGAPTSIIGIESGASISATGDPEAPSPERIAEIQLFGVTRYLQALREARYHLLRSAITPKLASFAVFLGDLDVLPGDVVTIRADRLSWPGDLFMVQSVVLNLDGTGRIEARQHDPRVYLDAIDRPPAGSVPISPSITPSATNAGQGTNESGEGGSSPTSTNGGSGSTNSLPQTGGSASGTTGSSAGSQQPAATTTSNVNVSSGSSPWWYGLFGGWF